MATERQIFEYQDWDGEKLHADPGEVARLIKEHTEGKFGQYVQAMRGTDMAAASEAVEVLKKATIRAFQLKTFDPTTGDGWLEKDVIALVSRFNDYLNGLKKNTAPSPTASMPTAV